MAIKKTVSDKVLAANRANAQKSTGPKTAAGKATVGLNALRHGMLARRVICSSPEQRAEFDDLVDAVERDFQPQGLLERMLAEEVAVCWWKLIVISPAEHREVIRLCKLPQGFDWDSIGGGELKTPISSFSLPVGDAGWGCAKVHVRSVSSTDKTQTSTATQTPSNTLVQKRGLEMSRRSSSDGAKQVALEFVVTSALDTFANYAARAKRDFYRAVKALREAQAARREEELKSGSGH
jgi:hypothetical protein